MSHLSFFNLILNIDIQADPELNLHNVFYKKLNILMLLFYCNSWILFLEILFSFLFSIQKSKIVKAGFIGLR